MPKCRFFKSSAPSRYVSSQPLAPSLAFVPPSTHPSPTSLTCLPPPPHGPNTSPLPPTRHRHQHVGAALPHPPTLYPMSTGQSRARRCLTRSRFSFTHFALQSPLPSRQRGEKGSKAVPVRVSPLVTLPSRRQPSYPPSSAAVPLEAPRPPHFFGLWIR